MSTSALIKTLPVAALMLLTATGCELINFDQPIEPIEPPDTNSEGGPPAGPAPLYPFRPGSTWQYRVTGLDGSMSTKWVAIDPKPVMVGGNGPHQLDMAYPVRTTTSGGGSSSVVRMQQAVGDQVFNWRQETFDLQGQLLVDVSWEPQQLEIDQSTARTRPGVSWLENYTTVTFPIGGVLTSVQQSESWTVVGQETLSLPAPIMMPFQTIVFQRAPVTGGGGGDAGTGSTDAGKADAGVSHPMLTGQTWSDQADSGVAMPKTLWYARGYGKVKVAGGGEPTEELSGLELK